METQETKRTFVYYPEEPDSYLYLAGKMVHFVNGRVFTGEGGQIGEQDLAYFEAVNQRLGLNKYLIHSGSPTVQLILELTDRVTAVCASKAHASNPGKVTEDARFTLAVMLSESNIAVELPPLMSSSLQTVRRIMPNVEQDPFFKQLVGQEEAARADDLAIRQGLDGADPDELDSETLEDDVPNFGAPPSPEQIQQAQTRASKKTVAADSVTARTGFD